ncbi:MAG TPA: sigma factor, partial [Gemmata sp.]|nr:sigma factor [Gemmata sp.]
GSQGAEFATTHWSVILQARGADSASRDALGELIRAYWYPVYAFFRRKTGAADEADDLTQGLFTHLLEGNALAAVDPSRGRFRSYLIACCDHYFLNERERRAARKRGGGVAPLSFDLSTAEERYRIEPADHLTPERVYARTWALDLLDATLHELEADYSKDGNAALFQQLKPTLTASGDAPAYAEVAAACDMTVPAVKKAAQRLRERYRDTLRRRVGATLSNPDEVDQEIRELFEALASR